MEELTSTVTWTSSAEAVATISNAPGQRGLVSALTKGGVTFTAAQGDITATYPLQVSDASLTSITVNPPVAAIAKGTGQAFTATGTFSNNTTQDITAAATWSTSDAAIATLSDQGSAKVTATGVAPNATRERSAACTASAIFAISSQIAIGSCWTRLGARSSGTPCTSSIAK